MKKPIISAPINVITGTLGAGKTLFAIQQADLLVRTGQAKVIYQVGINEPDTRKLKDLPFPLEEWVKHADAGELKDAVIIVDEFHKWMPQRGPGRPPKWIEELAEARKRGCIFILLTQSVEFDHFLKGTRLNKHYYLSRKGFLPRSTIYEWTARFVADPEANKDARKEAVITLWRHPKGYYDWYVSAEKHRFKIRLPLRVWIALAFIPVLIYVAQRGFGTIADLSLPGGGSATAPAAVEPLAGSSLAPDLPRSRDDKGVVLQPTQDLGKYLAQFEALVPHMPWSGGVYQGREVTARPDIYCMAVGEDGQDGCNCYTEQVTPLSRVPLEVCQTIARHGIYNPYRAPMMAGMQGGAVMPAAGAVVPAGGAVSGQGMAPSPSVALIGGDMTSVAGAEPAALD